MPFFGMGPIFVGGLSGTLLGTKTRKTITGLCGLIIAITGAIAGLKSEASDFEYGFPAHRGYARWYADFVASAKTKEFKTSQQRVERVLTHIEREQADGKLEATENDLFKADLEMKKAASDDERMKINQQIIKLQATKQKLENQIKALTTRSTVGTTQQVE